ncbi:MAG: hypothetical protein GX237_02345 [Clostridiales bacterium]|nr:hypothetical protein [Clostridiales bacterium]
MEANNKRYQYGTNYNYIEGSTARKRDLSYNYALPDYDVPERERRQAPKPERQVRSRPKELTGINRGTLFVLTIAIVATLYCCIEFIMLQNDVSKMESSILTMERTLSSKKNVNDAGYEQIDMAYDLDYVYNIAVNELGMVYPNNNEVITFDKATESYVRQYGDIPD